MILGKAKNFFLKEDSFESVLFWGILFFAIIAAAVSAPFTASEGLSNLAVGLSIVALVYFLVLAFIAKKTKKITSCFFAMCFALNVFLFPPLFFYCGGFKSGMPFYCIAGLLLCTLVRGRFLRKLLLVVTSLLSNEISFYLAWKCPYLVAPIEHDTGIIDIMVSFFIMGTFIIIVVSYLIVVYNHERQKREVLIRQLSFFSKHDPLTGLYNRRFFINHLEENVWVNREKFYIMMFDIDDFKRINDTKGHIFGDIVLRKIAEIANANCHEDQGEISVRFGGEEFIQIFSERSYQAAKDRANIIRETIYKTQFKEHPETTISISGGLVYCNDPRLTDQTKMLSTVDDLLYLAKSRGKNQIADTDNAHEP